MKMTLNFLNLFAMVTVMLFLSTAIAPQAYAATASYKELSSEISVKKEKAIRLINLVGNIANERYSDERLKADADFAHIGFISRFQVIREAEESLAEKELLADHKTLLDCSKRLDSLIADLQAFLN